MNRNFSTFMVIVAIFIGVTSVSVTAAGDAVSSSAPVISFSQSVELPSPLYANSDNSNAGGNSGSSNAGGNSDNSNAGGNSGGNSGNSNAGGNSDNSNAGGNSGGSSGNSNAGGNSDNSNAGGNSDNSNTGGNSGNSNAGGNAGNSNAGGNTGNSGDAEKTLGISGAQVNNKENTREITLDLQDAIDAGESISVQGSVITISKGPVTISITTAEPRENNGLATAVVRSISLEHRPITARLKDTGTVSASFRAALMNIPPADSSITAGITEDPDQPARDAFDQAASRQGYQPDAIAYTMAVAKTKLEDGKDIGPATITMSMNPAWVADHGGTANIRVARFAEDGTSHLLETRYRGVDSSANQVFEGTSPGGLSIFALISVRAVPEVPVTPQLRPEPTVTGSAPINGVMNPLLIGMPLVILGIFFMVYKREF